MTTPTTDDQLLARTMRRFLGVDDDGHTSVLLDSRGTLTINGTQSGIPSDELKAIAIVLLDNDHPLPVDWLRILLARDQVQAATQAGVRRRVSDERLSRVLESMEHGGIHEVMKVEDVGERQARRLVARARVVNQ